MFPLRQVVRYEETMAVTRGLVENKRAGAGAATSKVTKRQSNKRQNALYSKRQWLMLMMMPMSLRTDRSPYPGETELNPCVLYTVLDCN